MKRTKIHKTDIISGFRILVFITLIMPEAIKLQAQEVTAKATVDTAKLLLGDQTYLRITVEYKAGSVLEWPNLSDTIMKGVEILKRYSPDTLVSGKNLIKCQQKFLITSFDSGEHTFPPIKLVLHSGAIHDTISTLSLNISVLNLQVDTTKSIYDIKKPYGAPITLRELLPYLGLTLTAIMLILLSIYVIRRIRKQKPIIPKRVIIEAPHIIALRELDKLKEEKLWQKGQVKEYYTRLTDIIRIYIEHRFQVPAMEQTSDEILNSLKAIALNEEATYIALTDLLTLADLVKFARALPLPDENESNILNAFLFVNNTKLEQPVQRENEPSSDQLLTEGKEVAHG